MKLNIIINFEDTYEIENISEDLSKFQFTTRNREGKEIVLFVIITKNSNPFLPSVYNLAFGPLDEDGRIDDKAVIKHESSAKVYSTLLLGALTFLNAVPDSFVGIDGSNLVRACLYYSLFQNNYDYLAQYFNVIGVNYYVRLLRGEESGDPFITDNEEFATQPFKIAKHLQITRRKLYNYFVFNLVNQQ